MRIPPGTDLVRTLEQRTTLVSTLANPDITLARAVGTYILYKRLDKSQNLKAAQALAGHANIGTTGDTYTDWSLDQQAETMREVLA